MRRQLQSSEAELVEAAAACSTEAFEAVWDWQRPRVRLIVSRFADSREDREDVESEVSLLLLDDRKRRLRLWRPIASFSTYLSTIVVRHCIQWAERRATRVRREVPMVGCAEGDDPDRVLIGMLAAPASDAPQERALSAEVSERLAAACMRLADKDRLVLGLRFGEGLDGQAIAQAIGTTRPLANLAVFRALRRLERALDTEDPAFWASVGN